MAGFEVVREFADGVRAVRITSPAGCDYEGARMGHCVGNSGYYQRSRIYSIRDGRNRPHATIEARFDNFHTVTSPGSKTLSERKLRVLQIKGHGNGQVPGRYRAAVLGLLDVLAASEIHDLPNIGCLQVGQRIVDVTSADAPADQEFIQRLQRHYGARLANLLARAEAARHLRDAVRAHDLAVRRTIQDRGVRVAA